MTTPGRPRDPAIDSAALAAARELLAEKGWEQTTMVAIAERAGVGKPALYRRWPSKTQLIFEAVFGDSDYTPIEGARDSADWIQRSFAYTLELFDRPDVKAALPGLLSTLREHSDLRAALWREFGGPGVDRLAETLGPGSRVDANATMLLIIGSSMLVRLLLSDDEAAPIAARLPSLVSPSRPTPG